MSDPIKLGSLLSNMIDDESDFIFEVRMVLITSNGPKLFEHWFKDSKIEAETWQLHLLQKYALIHDRVKIKIQPHLL